MPTTTITSWSRGPMWAPWPSARACRGFGASFVSWWRSSARVGRPAAAAAARRGGDARRIALAPVERLQAVRLAGSAGPLPVHPTCSAYASQAIASSAYSADSCWPGGGSCAATRGARRLRPGSRPAPLPSQTPIRGTRLSQSSSRNILQPLIDSAEAVMVFFHDSAGLGWGMSIVALTWWCGCDPATHAQAVQLDAGDAEDPA